jgi:hypothetical protein
MRPLDGRQHGKGDQSPHTPTIIASALFLRDKIESELHDES